MKRILFILAIVGSFVFTNADTNKEIADTKAKIAELKASLHKLEASQTTQIQRNEVMALAKKVESEKLSTHTEFGLISTKGNTNTLAYNLDTKINKSFDNHELTFLGDGEYASDNGVDKNKYFLEFNYGYKVHRDLNLEYLLGYKYDEFSGYDYQAYTGPGFKYKVIREEDQNLDLSSALLISKDKRQRNNDTYNYLSYRAKVEYSEKIFKNLKFEETFTFRTDVTKLNDYFIFSKQH